MFRRRPTLDTGACRQLHRCFGTKAWVVQFAGPVGLEATAVSTSRSARVAPASFAALFASACFAWFASIEASSVAKDVVSGLTQG